MKTREELNAEHEQALANLEREELVRAIIPEQYRKDASVCLHGVSGKKFTSIRLWNNFRADKKLSDAIEMVKHFETNIIECGHWKVGKNGCCSTWPDAINGQKKDEHSHMDGSHVVEISVEGGKGYGPYTEIEFWVDLPELGLIEFSCPVCDLLKLVPQVYANYSNHGELSSCDIRWPQERACVDSFRTWWSEKPAFKGSYYLAELPNFYSWAGSIKTPKTVAA